MDCKFSTSDSNNPFTVLYNKKSSLLSYTVNKVATRLALIMTILNSKERKYKDAS